MAGSSSAPVDRDRLESVRAEIGFARRSPREQGASIEANYDLSIVAREVIIRDARPIANELSLDREGFMLIAHKMPCGSKSDRAAMCSEYLDAMASFVKDCFHGSWVTHYRHSPLKGPLLRSAETSKKAEGTRRRSNTAHIDFSPVCAPVVAAITDQENGVPIRPYSRMMVIQTWRALSPPPQDFPLALCDASSILDTDLVDTYVRGDVTEKLWIPHYSPLHRWYYFSQMTEDELIIFKGYDSDDPRNPRSAHTSFDNRPACPSAHPRESIETRFFVYYE